MTENDHHNTDPDAAGVFVLDRVFDAPVEVLWQAWTEPEHFKRWYGPRSMTTVFCEIDFRVGGRYRCGMRSAEGYEHWTIGTYQAIEPLQRFSTVESMSDKDGNVVSPADMGMGDMPVEMPISVEFERLGPAQTRLTLRHGGWANAEQATQAGGGWTEAFDKLAEALASA